MLVFFSIKLVKLKNSLTLDNLESNLFWDRGST
uniref:Uncharacterized protein n=1 Tax=Arundo donax TaxID=35708 RepID=A0A0A9AMT0_ARUDO